MTIDYWNSNRLSSAYHRRTKSKQLYHGYHLGPGSRTKHDQDLDLGSSAATVPKYELSCGGSLHGAPSNALLQYGRVADGSVD